MRWITPEKLHLTLVFLGQTDAERVAEIAEAIGSVAPDFAVFDVTTGEAGGRVGGRRGGVAWLRLAEGATEVTDLARRLDAAIGSNVFEGTPPRPHLTVARGVDERALDDLRREPAGLHLGWRVDRVVLFRSYTDPRGSRYEELASAALGSE